MRDPSCLCKIIIRRHIVVVDNNNDVAAAAAVAGNDAPAPSNSIINNRSNRYDNDHVYYHRIEFPTIMLATGSEIWASFAQRIFQCTVIETSTSSRLLPLLVQLHPFQQRVTAYRLRFGYGYATVIFPTWKSKQQACGGNGINEVDNGDNDIVDALLEVNVCVCQSKDHDRNSTATMTDLTTPSYLEAHGSILDSIGQSAYSTDTSLDLHYHTLLGDAFSSNPHSTTPFPVVKSRTNVCYCIEDEFLPGSIADYELIIGTHGTSSSRGGSTGGGRDSDGRSGGNENREYILPKTVMTALFLEGGLGRNCDSSSSGGGDSGAGACASNGGGLDASSGSIAIVHQTMNNQSNMITKASSNVTIATRDGARADIIGDCQDNVDDDAPRQGGVVHANEVEIQNESVDMTTTNTIAKTNTSAISAVELGTNTRKKEKRKKLIVKESTTLVNIPPDTMSIPPSPARSTFVLDVETSPHSHKRRKMDTNDSKQNDHKPRNTLKEKRAKYIANQLSVAQLETDKLGGTTFPKQDIHTAAEKITNELEGSLQEMKKLPVTKNHVNIHTTEQNYIPSKLDDSISAVIQLKPLSIESQPNQESATAAVHSEKVQTEPAKKKSNIHTTSEKNARVLANTVAAVHSEKVQTEPAKKKSNIHTTSEKNARDLANTVAGEQKKAFGMEHRVACRARGRELPADHNSSTAYVVIPEGVKHGDELLCSHPACRISRKFLYCQHCKVPITKPNFSRHRHGEELEKISNDNQKDDGNVMSAGEDSMHRGEQKSSTKGDIICRPVGNAQEEKKKKEKTKTKATKTNQSYTANTEPNKPSKTTKTPTRLVRTK